MKRLPTTDIITLQNNFETTLIQLTLKFKSEIAPPIYPHQLQDIYEGYITEVNRTYNIAQDTIYGLMCLCLITNQQYRQSKNELEIQFEKTIADIKKLRWFARETCLTL